MAIPFDIELRELSDRDAFGSLHWMAYRLADERVLIDLTGIVFPELRGAGGWVRKTLKADIYGGHVQNLLSLGPPPDGYESWGVRPDMWSVSAAPVSIFNAHTAVNAGWAVDTCNTEWDLGEPTSGANLFADISLYLNLAVRDSDGILSRFSYAFRAVGTLYGVPYLPGD